MSYNGWLYGYGNPINRVDPSGRVPTEDGIKSGRFEYSCNCGWIDYGHANPSLANDIYNKLRSHPINSSDLPIRKDVLLYELRVDSPLINPGFAVLPVVKYPLYDQELDSIALSLHILREEYREGLQCLAMIGNSCFSEEDLTSDLIGFYMALNGISVNSYGEGGRREWLATICDFPILREGDNGAKAWSLSVFREYGRFSEGKTGIREWGSPRLIRTPEINSYCDHNPDGFCKLRNWPAEFSTIIPGNPSVNGKWWKYRGEVDGHMVPSNVTEIFFLYDECKWPWWLK